MLKAEAKRLEGTLVEAWTPAWGEYIGKLIAVTDTRPWRGSVEILFVKKYPISGLNSPGSLTWANRKPFPQGKVLEVGGINIKPYEGELLASYEASVQQTLDHEIALYQDILAQPYCSARGLCERALKGLQEQRQALHSIANRT